MKTPLPPRIIRPLRVLLWSSPVLFLAAIAALVATHRRKQSERNLRRVMRTEARRGNALPFYRAAHDLIETRLAARWDVSSNAVDVPTIHDRLGEKGAPLVEALIADQALRFGRAETTDRDLPALCAAIERSLGGAS